MRTVAVTLDRPLHLIKLPDSSVKWELENSRAVLLVHDMQKYFYDPFPQAEKNRIRDQIKKLICYAKNASIPVAFSGQSGFMTLEDRGLMADFWGAGMRPDYEERGWVEGLEPTSNDLVLIKTRYSAFHATQLSTWMENLNRDQLVLCGIYAHVGILSTALDAFTYDIQPFLVADAIGDMTFQLYESALNQAALTCAAIINSDVMIS